MRMLLIHSDYIKYEAKEKTKYAEEGVPLQNEMSECLVCFVSVESSDDMETVKSAKNEIMNVAENLNVKNLVIYPYAHLSSDLAPPDKAVEILRKMEEIMKEEGYQVIRAPFGWYKSFEIKCKGHPLSELSKSVSKEEISLALKSEETKKSHYYILTPDGKLVDVEDFDFSQNPKLKIFADYEMHGTRAGGKAPHLDLMRKLEIADYEEGSDPGNLKYYPKGRLIKSLLEEFVTRETIKYGAMEVETPVMYDYNHPTLHSYLQRFPARQYIVLSGKKKFFLRFAACFGQFLMLSKTTISYANLPLKLYELTRYSFRREQRGELVGLKRLRAFTMPDMHTIVADMNMAKEEFENQVRMCLRILDSIGLDEEDYEIALRFTRDFYEENREFIEKLAKIINRPIFVEMWDKRFFYFVLKFEANFVDAANKASALSTVQIDVENAKRYGITYVKEDGSREHPIIMHTSPSGAIERCMYALLEKEAMAEGRKPMLPLWLSPTQIRIIPVGREHTDYAEEVYGKLSEFRVDIDDRDITMGKKIREAEMEWIPYIVVVGDREVCEKKITVRIRKSGEVKTIDLDDFKDMVSSELGDMPRKPLPLPKYLSRRPKFR